MSARRYYSVPDTAMVAIVPQPVQHLAIGDAAKRAGGSVVFYTMEDTYTMTTHEVVLGKVLERPTIDGFVFFRLAQFFHGGRPQIAALRTILAAGYEVVFARDRLAIKDEAELEAAFPLLFACGHVEARDTQRGAFSRQISAAS